MQPLTKGIIRTRANTQLIDLTGGRAENVAKFVAFGVNGSLNIMGTAKVMDPGSPSGAAAEGPCRGALRHLLCWHS